MYEMYPDTWLRADERHHDIADKPRRRVRKEHSVVPAVLTHSAPVVRSPRPGA